MPNSEQLLFMLMDPTATAPSTLDRCALTVSHTPSGMSSAASAAVQTLLASGTAVLSAALQGEGCRQVGSGASQAATAAPQSLSLPPVLRCRRSCARRSAVCGASIGLETSHKEGNLRAGSPGARFCCALRRRLPPAAAGGGCGPALGQMGPNQFRQTAQTKGEATQPCHLSVSESAGVAG